MIIKYETCKYDTRETVKGNEFEIRFIFNLLFVGYIYWINKLLLCCKCITVMIIKQMSIIFIY